MFQFNDEVEAVKLAGRISGHVGRSCASYSCRMPALVSFGVATGNKMISSPQKS
jgi:hypothetical protein